jgi:hypothetical protein
MALVKTEEGGPAEPRFQECHDLNSTVQPIVPVGVVRGGILGEAVGQLVPLLVVETSEVLGLQLLDGLDVFQHPDPGFERSPFRHEIPPVSQHSPRIR